MVAVPTRNESLDRRAKISMSAFMGNTFGVDTARICEPSGRHANVSAKGLITADMSFSMGGPSSKKA